jgi:hypothetical protein
MSKLFLTTHSEHVVKGTDLSLATFAQSVLNGLAAGWIYILVALGLRLVFGIMNIVQGGRYEPTFFRLIYI